MVKTLSSMVELNTNAPDFALSDVVSGKTYRLYQNKGTKGTLVMFICNHCPYVKHVNKELIRLGNDYKNTGINIFAINSNDADSYPDDGPEKMKKVALELGYPFPYLYDETQEVAEVYKATCTPDFFLFNDELALVYRGELDSSRPGNNIPCDGSSLRGALDALLGGEPISEAQKPSLGCNIKWKINA